MRRGLLVVLALGGCDVVFHIDEIPAGGSGSNTPLDALLGSDAGPCGDDTHVGHYGQDGAGLLELCVPSGVAPKLESTKINTDLNCDMMMPLGNGFDACVIMASTLTVRSNVNVIGTHPLVLAASTEIVIESGATLDVSATVLAAGPGGDVPNCTGGPGGSDAAKGGAGGGGGSWQTSGGPGGTASSTAKGGLPSAKGAVTSLRGGCQGGTAGSGAVTGGGGGHGGGAVYLVAPTVSGDGSIFASGGGGYAGNLFTTSGAGGGGGGGSGGLIAIDASIVAFSGTLAANGGAGGGGGGAGAAATGGHLGGTSTSLTVAATGGAAGTGAQPASAGGDGAIGNSTGQMAGPTGNGAGAGGGGGGQGFIITYSTSPVAARTSPPAIHD